MVSYPVRERPCTETCERPFGPKMLNLPNFLVIVQSLLDQLCDLRHLHTSYFTASQNLFVNMNC